jgi:hypothetical protein
MAKSHAEGASKSLNKTIDEIEAFLQGSSVAMPAGTLRPFLHTKLADLAEKWLKRGFKRGCIQSQKKFRELGQFPKAVTYDATRELFAGQHRQINLNWKAKVKKAGKAKSKKKGK